MARAFLASDAMALAGVTDQIVYLEEGDVVDMQLGKYWVLDKDAQARAARRQNRARPQRRGRAGAVPALHAKGNFEQPRAIADTLEGIRAIVPELFGPPEAARVLTKRSTTC